MAAVVRGRGIGIIWISRSRKDGHFDKGKAFDRMVEAARAHELLERGGYAGKVVLVTGA
jgi:hypothetical protein